MDNELKQYLEAMKARINERIEQTKTKLLTAFHQWASPFEMRHRSHTLVLRALDIEVESLSDRVTKLDGGTLNAG